MSEPECISLNELIAEVQRLLASNEPEGISECLSSARLEPTSLAQYLHFNERHYTRNLVFKNDLFELLILCWGPGQRSWIHNHRGQYCWMSVVEGKLAIRNYQRVGCDQHLRTVKLDPLPEFVIARGSTAQVDPTEPVHLVWNPIEFSQPAVSLHVYSLPFDTCVVYDADQGLCRDITLFYTSEYGTLTNRHQGGGPLTALPACACTLSSEDQVSHCGLITHAAGVF